MNVKTRKYGSDYIIRIGQKYIIVNDIAKTIIDTLENTKDIDIAIKQLIDIFNKEEHEVREWINLVNHNIDEFEYYEDEICDLDMPIKVQWRLTDRCNLNCKHCWATDREKEEKIEYEATMTIVNKLLKADLMELTLTGGEVLTFPYFREVFEKLAESGVYITIFTNGTLLNNYIDLFEKYRETIKILVSIDGYEDSHDYIRGKGTFEKTISNIEKLTNRNIEVNVNMVMNRVNYIDLEKVVNRLNDINVKNIQLSHMMIMGNAKQNKSELEMTPKMYNDVQDILNNISKKSNFKTKVLYSNSQFNEPGKVEVIEAGTENKYVDTWKCCAGQTRITIEPTGKVLCCPFFSEYTLGNIKYDELKDIWESQDRYKFIDFRDKNSSGRSCVAYKLNRVVCE